MRNFLKVFSIIVLVFLSAGWFKEDWNVSKYVNPTWTGGYARAGSQGAKLAKLFNIGGLTFYKNHELFTRNADADFAMGSPTSTFTATRSAAAPATYIDSQGVINLTTTSNTIRNQSGYYDATGFRSQNGLMEEAAGTNLLTRTDGTASGAVTGGTLWTGWSRNFNTNVAPTLSNVFIPELSSIAGATSQRYQYTSLSDAATFTELLQATAVGTVVNGDTVTYSFWLRINSQSGVTIRSKMQFMDAALVNTDTFTASSGYATTGDWRKYTLTATTANASTSRVTIYIQAISIDTGDSFDWEIANPQVEKNPYATSFIPTTTAALTRGAETLKYPTLGNRTAASETVFIKFAPESVFANDGVGRALDSTDTKVRAISKFTTGTVLVLQPNATDSGPVQAATSTTPQANTSYVIAGVMQHASPYASMYLNGTSQGTYTIGDFTDPVWGTFFHIGNNQNGANQLNGIIQSVVIYNRALSASEVLQVSNILSSI